jgi:hypothetical protein
MKIGPEFASGKLIRGWLVDIGCTPIPRSNPGVNWAFEVNVPPGASTRITVVNPKSMPRAVLIVSQTAVSDAHRAAFDRLEDDSKRDFWGVLSMRLNNHDFIEFHLDGLPPDCPTAFQISVTRWDDGITLDSFHRSLSSVNKAYLDACACFREHLGEPSPAAGGEFEFKRLVQ